jgi:hypothetical protein
MANPLLASFDALSPVPHGSEARGTLRRPEKPPRPFGLTPPRLAPFEPLPSAAPRRYDPRIAYLTTIVSAWAYSDAATMATQLRYYGLPNCIVREFVVTNRAMLIVAAAYLVRSEDGRIGVLAFRGTIPDDFINWLTDADTRLTNFHYGSVHTGFYRNLEPLWKDVTEAIDAAFDPPATDGEAKGLRRMENLYVTGHSLGAAMAVIAAARIFTADYTDWQSKIRGVYTYGQPCVGDRAFAEHYDREFDLYRHVFHSDVVPHLPPWDVGAFRHFGTEFYASRSSDGWQENSPPRIRPTLFASWAGAAAIGAYLSRRVLPLRALRFPYSIEDHGPQGYIDTSRASLG